MDMKSKEVASIIKEDQWTVAEHEVEDKPFILRYRDALLHVSDKSGYSQILIVNWEFADPHHYGMPKDDELQTVRQFEDYLVQTFEYDCHGVFALAITGGGTRSWFFYTSDVEECERRINEEIPHREEPYPLELTMEDDPEWEILNNILADD